jgi:hypothetical protein
MACEVEAFEKRRNLKLFDRLYTEQSEFYRGSTLICLECKQNITVDILYHNEHNCSKLNTNG